MTTKKENTKKFELVENLTLYHNGGLLYRIRALKNFGDVKKGDIGGWVESEKNLSQKGLCWIYDDAKVSAKARVSENARVMDLAVVDSNARVYGTAGVCDLSHVTDYATVRGNSIVRDKSCVMEFGLVDDHAFLYDRATVSGRAQVVGFARVCDDSRVTNGSIVSGNSFIIGNGYIGGDVVVNGHERIDFTVIRSTDYVTYKDPFVDDVYYTASTSRDIWLSNDGSVCIGDNKGIPSESFIGRCVGAYENNTDEYLPISRVNYIKGIVENHKKLFNID